MNIKIRAWDSISKRMLMAYEPQEQPKREYLPFEICVGFSHYEKSDLKIMLSTGLKDADGREVFEGDVIFDGHDYYEVLWNDEAAGFCKRPYQVKNADEYRVGVRNMDYWRVVGHIYDGRKYVE